MDFMYLFPSSSSGSVFAAVDIPAVDYLVSPNEDTATECFLNNSSFDLSW
jgi:hypothetical protein